VVATGSLAGQFASAPVPGQPNQQYVWGTLQGSPTNLGKVSFGESFAVTYTHHGSITFGNATAVALISDSQGGQLNMTGAVTFIQKSAGVYTVVETFTTGTGTGAFANVTGRPILVGTVNLQTGVSSFTFALQLKQ